jgi:hypothetical protein
MNQTFDDEPRYVPILVREEHQEEAERIIRWLEAEDDEYDAAEAFYR